MNLRFATILVSCYLAVCPFGDAHAQSPEYRQGYADGFRDGYDKARQELRGQQQQAARSASIQVQSAYYGEEYGNGRCDATRYVRQLANGLRNASIDVSNEICGDPARGKRKSLSVTYSCATVMKTESAPEHRKLSLTCP
jgi:hypothetical protein